MTIDLFIGAVGADLCVCPDPAGERADGGRHTHTGGGEYIDSPLHRVVQWFKTMTTNEYIRHVKNNGFQMFCLIRNGYPSKNLKPYLFRTKISIEF